MIRFAETLPITLKLADDLLSDKPKTLIAYWACPPVRDQAGGGIRRHPFIPSSCKQSLLFLGSECEGSEPSSETLGLGALGLSYTS